MFTTSLDTVFLSRFIGSLFNWHLREKGLQVEAEVAVPVFFRGKTWVIFVLIWSSMIAVLLELKTAEAIIIAHEAQVLNYLRATALEVGLILNFGPKAQVRRLLFDNIAKQVKVSSRWSLSIESFEIRVISVYQW